MTAIPKSIIIDLVVIAILIISALIGRKRGFIQTISGLLALILAFSLAGTFATAAAPVVSEKYVAPYIGTLVEQKPQADTATTPEQLSSLFADIGLPEELVSGAISDISHSITQSIMTPLLAMTNSVAYKITYVVLFIVFFIILFLLFKLAIKLLDLAAKIPGINFFNKTLGLILGLISGYLIISILSSIFLNTGFVLSSELISETTVLKAVTNFSPLSLFAK